MHILLNCKAQQLFKTVIERFVLSSLIQTVFPRLLIPGVVTRARPYPGREQGITRSFDPDDLRPTYPRLPCDIYSRPRGPLEHTNRSYWKLYDRLIARSFTFLVKIPHNRTTRARAPRPPACRAQRIYSPSWIFIHSRAAPFSQFSIKSQDFQTR